MMITQKKPAYRYPTEEWILTLTLLATGLIALLIAGSTFFTGLLFVGVLLAYSYLQTRAMHNAIRRSPHPIPLKTLNQLAVILQESRGVLGAPEVDFLVAGRRGLNAYAFGLANPKTVVLFAELVEVMDAEELAFIIGHELGHVQLGHTTLNTLVGGLAGIPGDARLSFVLRAIFRSWNRACEYSADRAGLLACGNVNKAVSALLKVASQGEARTSTDLSRVYQQLEARESHVGGEVAEFFQTHPLTFKRIRKLRGFAKSGAYRAWMKG